jgi:Skp family chaperone for outer membrane proteins|tara:strand:- start:509 stop:700 length:192 start_codon:yes stop_codon:yes gene_type:complete
MFGFSKNEHYEKINTIDEETSELEDKLEDNPDDKKIQTAIDKLEARKEKPYIWWLWVDLKTKK